MWRSRSLTSELGGWRLLQAGAAEGLLCAATVVLACSAPPASVRRGCEGGRARRAGLQRSLPPLAGPGALPPRGSLRWGVLRSLQSRPAEQRKREKKKRREKKRKNEEKRWPAGRRRKASGQEEDGFADWCAGRWGSDWGRNSPAVACMQQCGSAGASC